MPLVYAMINTAGISTEIMTVTPPQQGALTTNDIKHHHCVRAIGEANVAAKIADADVQLVVKNGDEIVYNCTISPKIMEPMEVIALATGMVTAVKNAIFYPYEAPSLGPAVSFTPPSPM